MSLFSRQHSQKFDYRPYLRDFAVPTALCEIRKSTVESWLLGALAQVGIASPYAPAGFILEGPLSVQRV